MLEPIHNYYFSIDLLSPMKPTTFGDPIKTALIPTFSMMKQMFHHLKMIVCILFGSISAAIKLNILSRHFTAPQVQTHQFFFFGVVVVVSCLFM